jgi:F420-dependent oxidoreductase-like protein
MRIGINIGGSTGPDGQIDGLIARARDIESRGFPSVWMANIFGLDAVTTLALIGHATERLELGTAVVPSYPRHPMALAQQCLTAQAAAGGRFTLGLGLSHQIVIESMFGLSYDKPARHMREYLSVLGPLLRGEPAKFEGDQYRVNGRLDVPGSQSVPVVLAALGDRMLEIAGRETDGTILWMTGPKTIESHIGPKLRAAASDAGRADPRIIAGIPIALTSDPDAAREIIAKELVVYGQLPSYRGMLDKEGADGPADVAIVGDEAALDAGIARLRDAGVTDFNASIMPVEEGASERTLSYLEGKL